MGRRLAAFLAADVVDYSRLIREDEAGTLAALRELLGAPDSFEATLLLSKPTILNGGVNRTVTKHCR